MRISDWSSDVCSSDLLEVRRLERQIGEPLVRKAHRFQPPQPFGIARQAVAAHFLFGRDDLGDAFEEPHVVTRNAVDRSEEHTSELQSLMRNSYAVFCLNKKKNYK